MIEGPESAWKRLSLLSAPNVREYRVLEGSVTTDAGKVLFGLDSESRRYLFIPVDPETEIQPDRRSAGVYLVPQELEVNDGVGLFVSVSCRKAHLNAVFGHLVEEMLRTLSESREDPYLECRRTLARWRELIDREVSHVLSVAAQAGLFAELWWLKRLVSEDLDALQLWTGPGGGVYDFQSDLLALEVKATLSRDSYSFTINGLEQLEVPPNGELRLATMRLRTGSSRGLGLPELVKLVLQCGVDAHVLIEALLSAGYDSRDSEHYAMQRFDVSEVRVYRVTEGFPRLVRESLVIGAVPSRVSRVSYLLDLAGEPPVPQSDDEIAEFCERLLGRTKS